MGNGSGGDGEIVLTQEAGYALPENWRETMLPEDIRGDETLKALKDVPGMAKMLVHSQKMIGKDKIIIPGEGATDDDWADVYNRLGRPEKAEGYGLKLPDGIPEGVPLSGEMLTEFMETVHKLGLNVNQAKGISDWYNNRIIQGFKDSRTKEALKIDDAIKKLKTEWAGDYENRVMFAKRAFYSFMGDDAETVKAIDEKYGNDPFILRFLAEVGKAMSEDKLKGSHEQLPTFMTRDEAQSEINKIMGDPKHPYHIKSHPGHSDAIAYMTKLHEIMTPKKEK